jgi:8-oxo-dGTP pyrophosphatase MutT (NUDIX family)
MNREGIVLLLEGADGRIAMQQRDDMPYWGLFGGWIEAGETPESAAVRELVEELSIALPIERFQLKGVYPLPSINATAYVYHVTVDHELDTAVLHEGLDWRFMSLAEMREQSVIPHHLDILKHYYNL